MYIDDGPCFQDIFSPSYNFSLADILLDQDVTTCVAPSSVSQSRFQLLLPTPSRRYLEVRLLGQALDCSPVTGVRAYSAVVCDGVMCGAKQCLTLAPRALSLDMMCRWRCIHSDIKDYVVIDLTQTADTAVELCEVLMD